MKKSVIFAAALALALTLGAGDAWAAVRTVTIRVTGMT